MTNLYLRQSREKQNGIKAALSEIAQGSNVKILPTPTSESATRINVLTLPTEPAGRMFLRHSKNTKF
ncbi:MAG: hypothetical protein ACR2LT_05410 [Pyrinomonadaceae bacterium]